MPMSKSSVVVRRTLSEAAAEVPDEYFEALEVTHEQHLRLMKLEHVKDRSGSKQKQQINKGKNGLCGRIGALQQIGESAKSALSPRRRKVHNNSNNNTNNNNSSNNNNNNNNQSGGPSNLPSDQVITRTQSSNFTIASNETVKISNRSEERFSDPGSSSSSPQRKTKKWNKLKRIIGVNSSSSSSGKQRSSLEQQGTTNVGMSENPIHISPQRSFNETLLMNGQQDTGNPSLFKRNRSTGTLPSHQLILDDSFRGHLDGIDVLSLGGAQMVSLPIHPDYPDTPSKRPWDDFPVHSFAGKSTNLTAAQMVSDMLVASAGRNAPEVILEGLDDRWTVRLDCMPRTKRVRTRDGATSTASTTAAAGQEETTSATEAGMKLTATVIQSVTEEIRDCITWDTFEEDQQHDLPTQELWKTMWGSDPVPFNFLDLDVAPQDDNNNNNETINSENGVPSDDPILHMAAQCSVPIDIDEQTFIVSSREHLLAIHEIARMPLSRGDFDAALRVLEKLLKGLQLQDANELRIWKGATLHNIGMLHLWRGNFVKALTNFHLAVDERLLNLPDNHPDTVVSLIRKAMSFFALGRFEEAAEGFELAIPMMPKNHIQLAKTLNNLGVVYYQQRKLTAALKQFTKSLQIHRFWLEGSVRRETLVYDAAVTMSNLGKMYLEQSDYQMANYVYEEALLLLTSILAKDHEAVLSTMTSLALAKAKDGQLKKARKMLHGCLRLQDAKYGVGNPRSLESLGMIGYLNARLKDYKEALWCLNTVRKWQKAHLPINHPSLRQTIELIDAVQNRKNESEKSAAWI